MAQYSVTNSGEVIKHNNICVVCRRPTAPPKNVCDNCEAKERRRYDLAETRGFLQFFREDNAAGYTAEQLAALNWEFERRFLDGEFDALPCAEAMKQFADEVAGR